MKSRMVVIAKSGQWSPLREEGKVGKGTRVLWILAMFSFLSWEGKQAGFYVLQKIAQSHLPWGRPPHMATPHSKGGRAE